MKSPIGHWHIHQWCVCVRCACHRSPLLARHACLPIRPNYGIRPVNISIPTEARATRRDAVAIIRCASIGFSPSFCSAIAIAHRTAGLKYHYEAWKVNIPSQRAKRAGSFQLKKKCCPKIKQKTLFHIKCISHSFKYSLASARKAARWSTASIIRDIISCSIIL